MGRNRVLNLEDVLRDFHEEGLTRRQIADKYGCSLTTVNNYIRNRTRSLNDEMYISTPATYEDELKARSFYKAQREKAIDPAVLVEEKKPVEVKPVEAKPVEEPGFTITSITVTGKYLKATYEEESLSIQMFKEDVADIIPASLELAKLARYIQRLGVGKNALVGD